MQRDKIFLFLILTLIIIIFYPVKWLLRNPHEMGFNRVNFDLARDTTPEKESVYSKGIYITFRTAASKRMDELIDLVERTELNAVVIDIKDYTGLIPFNTDNDLINQIGSEKDYIPDIRGLINKLHQERIYVIARIAVFEDNFLPIKRPDLALKIRGNNLWRDFKGLTWVDPASQEVWDYTIALAKEAAKIGFDEINLDYIRFPSDGNTSEIIYPFWDYKTPKKEIIRQFFEYFSQRVKPIGVFVSADLFGLTLTSTNDLNIGQWLEDAALYFDYICPMVYPSHYPEGYEGFTNPAIQPYEVIYKALLTGQERLASVSAEIQGGSAAKLRPWLQDFDLGANYDAEMVNLEKKAVYDAGAYGWLLWNPKNIYTEDALIKEE